MAGLAAGSLPLGQVQRVLWFSSDRSRVIWLPLRLADRDDRGGNEQGAGQDHEEGRGEVYHLCEAGRGICWLLFSPFIYLVCAPHSYSQRKEATQSRGNHAEDRRNTESACHKPKIDPRQGSLTSGREILARPGAAAPPPRDLRTCHLDKASSFGHEAFVTLQVREVASACTTLWLDQ